VTADRIELNRLRALGIIGVNPEERDRHQPFELDLVVEADLHAAGESDDLHDTIDYGAVCGAAEAVVRTERHQLLERVAARVVDEVLGVDPRIEAVTVTIRKLRPPLPQDIASSAVTITRRRR
jgi:dihydroneopterin aldolase